MDTDNLHLYRRRFIPDELIYLKDDKILKFEDNLLITSWKTLNPKTDFASGVSAFFIDKNWKVSKILDHEGNLMHWYCDIIDCLWDEDANSLTYEDLLFDVVVYPNGMAKVLDCDEAAEAREKGLITEEQLLKGLKSMNELLNLIYQGRFDRLEAVVEGAIAEQQD